MSVSSVQQELVTMQTNTAVNKAKEMQANGASQELDGDAFLMLMLEQLKHQDPMNPMDNTEMLAQQAQFTQIQELQKMNEAINTNNTIQQANSLVGKTVQVVDPNNTSRLITGLVTSANFAGDSVTVTVNGNEYPLGLVTAVTDGASATPNNILESKKLSELSNAPNITNGYVTLTLQDNSYKKKNVEIEISGNMTVKDLIDKFNDAGVNASLSNGIITIEKGDNKSITLSQGKANSATTNPSNLLEKMQMFQTETGNIETAILDFTR